MNFSVSFRNESRSEEWGTVLDRYSLMEPRFETSVYFR